MKDFNLKEEIISGFTVTSDRKKVWNVELDLLKKFIEVCNKYNLKYFIFSGSMIGVIRHQGFIPWDDDIDVAMLREDYNKLLEIADKEFNNEYFFQTPYNDKLYRGHAQLRNSNTTGILPREINMKYNQGIFLDIFPLDEYPSTKEEYDKQNKKLLKYKELLTRYYDCGTTFKSKIYTYLIARPIVDLHGYKNYYKKYEKECSKYNGKGNGIVSNLSLIYDRKKNNIYREELDEMIEMPFENIMVTVPKKYDNILKRTFGEYMVFKHEATTHGDVLFSTEIPYKEFIKKYKNKEINLEDFYLK